MPKTEGTCPECGSPLERQTKTKYFCTGCGLSFAKQTRRTLYAAVAVHARKILKEQGPLPGKDLATLLFEKHGNDLAPLMMKSTREAGENFQRVAIRASMDIACQKGLLGRLPPVRARFCTPDHPGAVVKTTKPPAEEIEDTD